MDNKSIFATIISSIALVLTILLLAGCGGNKNKVSTTAENSEKLLSTARVIKVVQVDGKATVTDSKTTTDCYKGMNLFDGDTLRVLAESTLVVKFDEDKYVYLGENTTIKIKSEGTDKYKTNVFVSEGVVLAEIKNKLGEDEEFFLSSNNSVMAVRGTIFGVEVKVVGDEVIQSYSVYKGATELYVFDKEDNNFISGKISDISNSKFELRIPRSHILSEAEISNAVGEWLDDATSKFDDAVDANEKLDKVQITVTVPTQQDFEKVMNIVEEINNNNENTDPEGGNGKNPNNDPTNPEEGKDPNNGNPNPEEGNDPNNEEQELNNGNNTNPDDETITNPNTDNTSDPDEITPDDPITYTDIEYTSNGFFGEYDGVAHKVVITPTTTGATVTYKGEGETEYKDTNDYEFYAPGSYRVYYKIECEGHNTKEDYEVVYITKPTIRIESDCITYDNISKMSVIDISGFDPTDFNIYNGVSIDKVLENASYLINGNDFSSNVKSVNYNKKIDYYIELVDGKNTLNLEFLFADYSFTAEASFLFSDSREDSGYAIGVSDSSIEKLSDNVYYINNAASFVTSVGVGAYESEGSELLSAFGLDVLDLETMLINYPYNVKGTDTAEYDGRTTITLEGAAYGYVKVNFLVFPTATTKGFNETIYVTVKADRPEDGEFATYSINKTSYAYDPSKNPDGVKMDFVTSSQPVKYSLDGTNFTDDLYLTQAGNHQVFYKVIVNENYEDFNIVNYEYINVIAGQGEITFDNMKFITNPVHILSNDGNTTNWSYEYESVVYGGPVLTNNNLITSLDDAYTVYSNMIKNAIFYDSISNETIDAVVTIERSSNSANFDYKIEADGYETLRGTVRFDYSEFGELQNIGTYTPGNDYVSVTIPEDYEISLSIIPQAIPSRISCSLENEFINYAVYYSVDSGKTWSTDAPTITEAGNYEVYVMYCFVDNGNDATTLVDGEIGSIVHSDLAANGNFIIAIQNIVVED